MAFFESISNYNGWSMALVGASIVLCGLTLLATILSQLHKIIAIFEKRDSKQDNLPGDHSADRETAIALEHDRCPADISETASLYKPLVGELGDQFQLADLYALANQYQFPHPHLSIRCLRESGNLIPLGDGEFRLAD